MIQLYKSSVYICLLFLTLSAHAQKEKRILSYPTAPVTNQSDNYFGTIVQDPYRLLEVDTKETQTWLHAQQKLHDSYFSTSNLYFPIRKRIKERSVYQTTRFIRRGSYYFVYKFVNNSGTASLYYTRNLKKSSKLLIEPGYYNKSSSERANIVNISVSKDNRFLAFCLSYSGSDWKEIKIIDINSGKQMPETLQWVKLENIQWKNNGFYYSRFDAPPEGEELKAVNLNTRIYYHVLGTEQIEDKLIYEQAILPKGIFNVQTTTDERFLIVYGAFRKNDRIYTQISCLDFSIPNDSLRPFLIYDYDLGYNFQIIDNINNKFITVSNKNANNQQILIATSDTLNQLRSLVPESKHILRSVSYIDSKLLCIYSEDLNQYALTFDTLGNVLHKIKFPEGSTVGGIEAHANDSTCLLYYYSYTYPPIIYEYDLNRFETKLIAQTKVSYDYKSLVTKEIFYTSDDGTKIPMLIVHKKGMKQDGSNPCILYGYGGYGVPLTPFFDPGIVFFIENGGIFVIPALRGGGEYGDSWHKAGQLFNKENVFNDFIAAAEYLIEKKYTSPQKLAIRGGSNGGLLVCVVSNRRPDLFAAVISEMAVLDMLRYHLFTVGYLSEQEFGSSRDSAEFLYLYKYSPLHTIKDSTSYPASYIITGDHDDRVPSFHSYKYVATLQSKNKGQSPILLKVQKNAGHFGSIIFDDIMDNEAYLYTFLFLNLGIRLSAP